MTTNAKLNQFKVKIFCAHHNAVGFNKGYQFGILTLILLDCFVFNLLFDSSMDKCRPVDWYQVMACLDVILLTILSIELIIRLWAIDCILVYSTLKGKFQYLKEYRMSRLADLLSVIVFAWSIAFHLKKNPSNWNFLVYRVFHLTQVIQFYRIFSKISKVFTTVIIENFRILIVPVTIFTAILIILSFSVYFVEQDNKGANIRTIFDPFWFGFITLTTVGYGDTKIYSGVAKVVTTLLVFCGICVYSLPSAYIGSALAMKLQEKQQSVLIYQPAASLIQRTWKCYAIQMLPKYIGRFILAPCSVNRKITSKNRYIIILLHKLSFLLAQNRFKYSNLVHSTGGAPLQYVRLQRKIELINEAIRKHKNDIRRICNQMKDISKNLRSQNSSVNK